MKFLNNHRAALVAPFQGLKICLLDHEIRKLALWPWLIGGISYCSTILAAVYSHAPLLEHLLWNSTGWLASTWNLLAYIIVSIGLLIVSFIISIGLVLIFSGVFQSSIAEAVLIEKQIISRKEDSSLKGYAKEASRTILSESLKLFWLVPLVLLIFMVGFIPFMAPLALGLGAWLLAYQFVDTVLDVLKVGALKRLRFSLKHSVKLTLFGLVLTLCWAVPLLGILLTPAAAAAAAWFLADSGLLNDFQSSKQ